MRVLGISGQLQNGKDSLYLEMRDMLDRMNLGTWHKVAFGDHVKDVICFTFGISREFIEQWKCSDKTPPGFCVTMRRLMQIVGDGLREANPNVWIDAAFEKGKRLKNIVITDCRYMNEVKAIRERHGGLIIRIWRPGYENDDSNASESEMVKYDMPLIARYREILEQTNDKNKASMAANDHDLLLMSPYDVFIVNDIEGVTSLRSKSADKILPIVENAYKYML